MRQCQAEVEETMRKASERELKDAEARRQKDSSLNVLEIWQVPRISLCSMIGPKI